MERYKISNVPAKPFLQAIHRLQNRNLKKTFLQYFKKNQVNTKSFILLKHMLIFSRKILKADTLIRKNLIHHSILKVAKIFQENKLFLFICISTICFYCFIRINFIFIQNYILKLCFLNLF